MRSLHVLLGLGVSLAGCANVGDVLNTALASAMAAPVFSENFEAPASSNYAVVRAGQSFRFTSLVGGDAGVTSDAISVAGGAGAGPPAARNLSGEYAYLGQGTWSVTQTGATVRMLCTWAPAGRGPHYEIRGTLAGDTITGEWFSHYANKGWYRCVGRVLPDGSVEQSQSDDPIRSNIKTAVLERKP